MAYGRPPPGAPQEHVAAQAGGSTELEDLFVDPGWRRRGIAAALVTRIVDVLRARGVEFLEVTANPNGSFTAPRALSTAA